VLLRKEGKKDCQKEEEKNEGEKERSKQTKGRKG
jgi:hypothetical protein